MTLDEKIEVVIELLTRVLMKLERLENELSKAGADPALYQISLELATLFSKPIMETLEAARRVYSIIAGFTEIDPISKAVIYVLSACEPYTISEITRKVRDLRGSSSRWIISDRLRGLEARGIVINIGSPQRPRFTLKACMDDNYGKEA
ncbi:MAG: ArsR family transcriptional regulator [Thermosphaera sp.]